MLIGHTKYFTQHKLLRAEFLQSPQSSTEQKQDTAEVEEGRTEGSEVQEGKFLQSVLGK